MSKINEIQLNGAAEDLRKSSSLIGESFVTFSKIAELVDAPFYAPEGDYQASIDNLRFRLKFNPGAGERLKDRVDILGLFCDESHSFTSKAIPGKYLVLANYKFANGSGVSDVVTLGIGQVGGNSKVNLHRGFLEFNPNKVCKHKKFIDLLAAIAEYVSQCECVRYDLAVDYLKKRTDMMVVKDHRMYGYYRSNGITETLGRRANAKFVRVYDKAAEQHMQIDLTRIEITCDGAWTIEGIRDAWPKVHSWSINSEKLGAQKSKDLAGVAALAISEIGVRGGNVDIFLSQLGYRSKAKLMSFLDSPFVEFPEDAAKYVLGRIRKWELLQYPGKE